MTCYTGRFIKNQQKYAKTNTCSYLQVHGEIRTQKEKYHVSAELLQYMPNCTTAHFTINVTLNNSTLLSII